MADLFSSISAAALPRLGLEPSQDGGVKRWLEKGSYRASSSSTPTNVVLENISVSDLVEHISFDYERFSLASWESFFVSGVEQERYQLAGWPLLKMYYAGFFAAHAIMRGLGEGIVKVDRRQTEVIEEVVKIGGGDMKLKPGMFSFKIFQASPGQAKVSLSPHGDGSGVHEGFWKSFLDFLERGAASAVAGRVPDASLFVAGVSEIAPMMKVDPDKKSVWYSAIRNEINYQHKYDVWHPLKNSRKINDSIKRMSLAKSSSIRLDIERKKNTINAFINTSQFFCCLNWELANYIATRSTKPRAFGAKWRQLLQVSNKVER